MNKEKFKKMILERKRLFNEGKIPSTILNNYQKNFLVKQIINKQELKNIPKQNRDFIIYGITTFDEISLVPSLVRGIILQNLYIEEIYNIESVYENEMLNFLIEKVLNDNLFYFFSKKRFVDGLFSYLRLLPSIARNIRRTNNFGSFGITAEETDSLMTNYIKINTIVIIKIYLYLIDLGYKDCKYDNDLFFYLNFIEIEYSQKYFEKILYDNNKDLYKKYITYNL